MDYFLDQFLAGSLPPLSRIDNVLSPVLCPNRNDPPKSELHCSNGNVLISNPRDTKEKKCRKKQVNISECSIKADLQNEVQLFSFLSVFIW